MLTEAKNVLMFARAGQPRPSSEPSRPMDSYWHRTRTDFQPHVDDFHRNFFGDERFDWTRDVRQGLKKSLDALSPEGLTRLATVALPVTSYPEELQAQFRRHGLPQDADALAAMKTAIADRQFQALVDITNHALGTEQMSVAPLTTAVRTYKHDPTIQHAMTAFINDEAKHAHLFERYMREKLGGEVVLSKSVEQRFDGLGLVSSRMPAVGVFSVLAVEAIGGAFFDFFGRHCSEPLFRDLCKTIYEWDEQRHMRICQDLYNEKWRRLNRWERFRNNRNMQIMVSQLYKEHQQPDHYLMQACQAFGQPPDALMRHVDANLKQAFQAIGVDFIDLAPPAG